MRCTPHYHMIDLPSGRKIRTVKDCNTVESLGELGKFNLGKILKGAAKGLGAISRVAAPIAGGVMGGPQGAQIGAQIGKVTGDLTSKIKTGKKKGGKEPSPVEAAVMPMSGEVSSSGGSVVGLSQNELLDILKSPLLKNQLVQALRDYNASQAAADKSAKKVTSNLTPRLDSILALAQQANLKQQVTQEHKAKVQDSSRWKNNTAQQNKILQRLDALEKKIDSSHLRNRAIGASFGVPGNIL